METFYRCPCRQIAEMLPKPLYITLRVIVPILIVGAGLLGFQVLANLKQDPDRSVPETQVPLVQTTSAERHAGELTIRVDGTVVPFRDVSLSAEVAGRIVTKGKNCLAGRYVRAGELLFEIDVEEYQLEIDRLTLLQRQSEASRDELGIEIENEVTLVELARTDLARAIREHNRTKELFAADAATDAQLDASEQMEQSARRVAVQHDNALRLKTAQRIRLDRGIDLVAAQLKRARLDLARTRVTSPVSGVVVADHVEESAYVQRGTPLVTVEDTSAVDVRCSLRMEELYWLWQHVEPEVNALDVESQSEVLGQSLANRGVPPVDATVIYELSGQQFTWRGQLSRYDGAGLDEFTRTAACRVNVPDPTAGSLRASADGPPAHVPPALFRGMFVEVEFHLRPRTPLLRIPERAVRPGSIVWRVKDERLERITVHVVRIVDGTALVLAVGSALSDGDRIVVSPLSTETSGLEVREQPIDGA
jgi:multidrug efflux pump subunit AcrA (membrane-fusion protein)